MSANAALPSLPTAPIVSRAFASAASRSMEMPASITVRASASALRRNANASLFPVGFNPAANPPANVSSRSAIASTCPGFDGAIASPPKRGM